MGDINNALLAWLGVNALALLLIVFKAGGYTTRVENLEKIIREFTEKYEADMGRLNDRHQQSEDGRHEDSVLITKLDGRMNSIAEKVDSIHRSLHDLRNWLIKHPPGPG